MTAPVNKLPDGSTNIEKAIQAWVSKSGITTIWSQQPGPRPATPYISMLIMDDTGVGDDWYDTEDNPLTFSPITVVAVSVSPTNTLTATAHGFNTGDGPVQFTTAGTLPGGLALLTDYWVVAVDANTLKLATTFPLAIASTPDVVLTTAGAGALTLSAVATTVRAGAEINNVVRGPHVLTLSLQCFASPAVGTANARNYLSRVLSSVTLPSVAAGLVAAGVGVGTWTKVSVLGMTLNMTVFEPRATVTVKLHVASEISETGTYIQTVAVSGVPPVTLPD